MKLRHLIFTALLATTLTLQADEQPQPVPRRAIGASSQLGPDTQPSSLSRNYMLTIKGSLGKSELMDAILRGSSSKFSATLENPSRRIEIIIREDGDALTVVYSLGARIAIKTGENSFSYQDASVTGSFLATLGEPFSVLEVSDTPLTIQVDQIPTKKQ